MVCESSEFEEVDDKHSTCWDPGSMFACCIRSIELAVALLERVVLSVVLGFGMLVGGSLDFEIALDRG